MLVLAKNGVPWSVIEAWEDEDRMAAEIVLGELEGGEFNWDRMRWLER